MRCDMLQARPLAAGLDYVPHDILRDAFPPYLSRPGDCSKDPFLPDPGRSCTCYPPGGYLLFVVVPVLVPVGQRHGPCPSDGLGEDVLDLLQAGARIACSVAQALNDRFRRQHFTVVMVRPHYRLRVPLA